MEISEIEKQLKINKNRQEIIDALLTLREHSDLVQSIKALSENPKQELMYRFNLNDIQASALIDLKRPIVDIPEEKIFEERKNLLSIEKELKFKIS